MTAATPDTSDTPATPPAPEWIALADAVARSGASLRTLQRAVAGGHIPRRMAGRAAYLDAAALDAWTAARGTIAATHDTPATPATPPDGVAGVAGTDGAVTPAAVRLAELEVEVRLLRERLEQRDRDVAALTAAVTEQAAALRVAQTAAIASRVQIVPEPASTQIEGAGEAIAGFMTPDTSPRPRRRRWWPF